MRTWRDNYPTGRKFCSKCGRWRLCVDFNVRQWADDPICSIPRTFQSACRVCMARMKREKKGFKLRQWYPNGLPGSQKHLENRRAVQRKYHRRKYNTDPNYRINLSEYKRFWRSENIELRSTHLQLDIGDYQREGTVRRKDKKVKVDAALFLEWMHFTEPQLTSTEKRLIYEAKENGALLDISIIDGVMTRYGATDQFQIFYPGEETEAA